MEKDTVCISIQDYLELNEIREKILNSKLWTCQYHRTMNGLRLYWYTDSEVIKELIRKNNMNSETIEMLENELLELKNSRSKKPWWKIF